MNSLELLKLLEAVQSGKLAPAQAIEWVCKLEGLQSIVFGASTAANIRHTKTLIENAWGLSN